MRVSAGGWSASSGTLFRSGPDDKVHFLAHEGQNSQKLADGVPWVCRVEQAVELTGRRTELPGDLPLAEAASLEPFSGLDGQLVQEEVLKVVGVGVEFEDRIEMECVLVPGCELIGEGLVAEFRVDEDFGDLVLRRGSEAELGIRNLMNSVARMHLEGLLPSVGGNV